MTCIAASPSEARTATARCSSAGVRTRGERHTAHVVPYLCCRTVYTLGLSYAPLDPHATLAWWWVIALLLTAPLTYTPLDSRRYFMTATLAPRMNVDNGLRIFKYNGAGPVCSYSCSGLAHSCVWIPAPTSGLGAHENRPPSPNSRRVKVRRCSAIFDILSSPRNLCRLRLRV